MLKAKKQNWNPPRPNGWAGRAEMEEIEMLCKYLSNMAALVPGLESAPRTGKRRGQDEDKKIN